MADGQLLKAEPIVNDRDKSFYKRTNLNTGQSEEIRHSRVYGGISECEKDSLDIRHYGCIMSKARADFRAEKITGTKASSLDGNRYQNDSKDDFTELKQLIVDIHEMDNEDFGNRGRRSGSIPISWDSYYPDSRIYRFKEAINGFFSDLSFDGVYTKNGEKCIVFTKNGNEIPIDSLSTGEKQIVFRGVYLLQNLEQFDGATVFIDEPELSMHPKWQEKILQYYQNLFKRGDGTSRVQLFVALHSEILLEAALEDKANTLVIVLKSNQGSIDASEVRQPFILPTITSSEIHYLAFDVCSIDYHIALYGEIQSSTLLHLKVQYRIEVLQFDSSIVSGELPIDTFLRSISLCIPSCKLLIKFFDIANTSFSQTLVAKSREFNFSDIKPTPMFWCVVNLKTFCKPKCFVGRECLIE